MSGIKAILFDFGGTLDSDGEHWFARLYHGLSSRFEPLSEEEFQTYADAAAAEVSALEDTARLSMGQMVERLCEYIQKHILNGVGANNGGVEGKWNVKEWADEFVAQSRILLARNRGVLAKLRGDYRLGCISNNWGNTAGWCEEFGLSEYFDTMIDSAVVGSVKPEEAIFLAALGELQLAGQECAYVGDRYDCDVLGAHQAGLTPVWITGGQQQQYPADGPTCQQIKTLADLLEMDL